MLTQGKSNLPIQSAEEYIIQMMSSLRNPGGSPQDLPGANRTAGLVMSVKRSLANCRWELLQEAFTTLGKLLEIEPEMLSLQSHHGQVHGPGHGPGQGQMQQNPERSQNPPVPQPQER